MINKLYRLGALKIGERGNVIPALSMAVQMSCITGTTSYEKSFLLMRQCVTSF